MSLNPTPQHHTSENKRKHRWLLATLGVIALVPVAIYALNPGYAPGGNFDMEYWNLQLPIGSAGNPTIIPSSELQGQNGYQNYSYFFTESGDGAMVMKVPGSPSETGCVTTTNSTHCRTELAETSSWSPNNATNRLKATLAVEEADPSQYGTVIGQIHMDASVSTKPVCELYYSQSGDIYIGVEQTRSGDDEVFTYVGNVPLGTQFSYEIEYYDNQLKVALNNNFLPNLNTYSLDAPLSYFKAGNYNQSSGSTSGPSDVHFYALTIQH
jgi:hypothetical protein